MSSTAGVALNDATFTRSDAPVVMIAGITNCTMPS